MIRPEKEFSHIGFVFSFLTVVMLIFQYILVFIISILSPSILENINIVVILSSVPLYIIGTPILYFALRSRSHEQNNKIKQITIPFFELFKLFCMSYTLMFIGNLLGVSITDFIGELLSNPVDNPIEQLMDGVNPLVIFAVTVIGAPIFEEIFFRKMLIDKTIIYGERVSVIFSGILFGLFHGNLNQFFYATFLGAFLAYIYIRSGRLIYCIALHAAVNSVGTIIGILLESFESLEGITSGTASDETLASALFSGDIGVVILIAVEFLIFAILILGIYYWARNFTKLKLYKSSTDVRPSKYFNCVFLNFGMLSFWFISTVLIVNQILG